MTTRTLHAWWGEDLVGRLERRADDVLTFRYEPGARAISRALPFDDGREARPTEFFSNLLPDGVQRERLARRLGVSQHNTLALLEAIGGDCAGALSLLPEGATPASQPATRTPLTDDLLAEIGAKGVIAATLDRGLRLSLAGAQDKLPVLRDGDALFLPGGSLPSTHVLKLPSRDFRGLCANELFMLTLASNAGIPVVGARPWPMPGGGQALLVARYDRLDGRRLHQEDSCQALARPPSRKYEADGGPSFSDLVTLLREESANAAADIEALLRWQAFNCVAGNDDGHAKNVSMLREPSVRLAPFYDLVCTRAWDQLARTLALAVGGQRDAGHVGPRAWAAEARASGVGTTHALGVFASVTDAVARSVRDSADEAIANGAEPTPVRRARSSVEGQCKRSERLLRAEGR